MLHGIWKFRLIVYLKMYFCEHFIEDVFHIMPSGRQPQLPLSHLILEMWLSTVMSIFFTWPNVISFYTLKISESASSGWCLLTLLKKYVILKSENIEGWQGKWKFVKILQTCDVLDPQEDVYLCNLIIVQMMNPLGVHQTEPRPQNRVSWVFD